MAAFTLSVLCHALVLLGARGWRLVEARPVSPLVVRLVGQGGGDGAAAAAGAAPAAAPAPAPVAPAVAPEPVPPRRRAARRAPTLAPRVPPRSAARLAATPPVAAADAIERGAETASEATDPGVVASVAGGGPGAGGSGSGGGSGGGVGTGSGAGGDGLRALCASCPAPEYPGRARRQGWQGTVDVALTLGRDGSVVEARVDRSSGYPTLDEVALDVARRSRFSIPDGGNGLRGQLRYRFVLDATAARR